MLINSFPEWDPPSTCQNQAVDTTLGKAARQVLYFLALSCPAEVSGSSAATCSESRNFSIRKVQVFYRLPINLSVAPSSQSQSVLATFTTLLNIVFGISSLNRDATDGGTFLAQLTAIWSAWPGRNKPSLAHAALEKGSQHWQKSLL